MAQDPKLVPVDIELVDGVRLTCSPDPVHVNPSDTIKWTSPSGGTHKIEFRGTCPLVDHTPDFMGERRGKVDNVDGKFKYEVTVRANGGEFFLDPTIIVERPT